MTSHNVEQELAAITAIIKALEELDDEGRARVIRYVFDHLKLPLEQVKSRPNEDARDRDRRTDTQLPTAEEHGKKIVDIRTLREEKQPSTDVQMVSIVAYYLAELAPPSLRKDSINVSDVTEYFKQAGHPLPAEAKYTLTNARNAGYLDAAGNGQYKLNPVGHNLVVHKLPRPPAEGETKKAKVRKQTRKAAGKSRNAKKS